MSPWGAWGPGPRLCLKCRGIHSSVHGARKTQRSPLPACVSWIWSHWGSGSVVHRGSGSVQEDQGRISLPSLACPCG